MRYYFTDFYHWEQKPMIDQLRADGKFVYSVIDAEGEHYLIRRGGFVNRFAFLITDEDIIPNGRDDINDEEFNALGGEEDKYVMNLSKDISAEIAAARKDYEMRHRDINLQWEEIRRRCS